MMGHYKAKTNVVRRKENLLQMGAEGVKKDGVIKGGQLLERRIRFEVFQSIISPSLSGRFVSQFVTWRFQQRTHL